MDEDHNFPADGATGDQFLATYARLESWMRNRLRKDQGYGYKRMVADLEDDSAITGDQARQLVTFGYLRNALAHWEHSSEGAAIADPREDAVRHFEELAKKVMRPSLATDAIGVQTVLSVESEDQIDDFLDIVREHNFSQVPVMSSGSFVGVLSVGDVARWLADKEWPRPDDFRRARIAAVRLEKFEEPDFIERPPSLTTPEAIAAFNVERQHGAISGIVVVDRHPGNDRVLAMILPWDLPQLLRAT